MFKRSMWSMWLWSGVLFATIASTSMAENNHPINGIVAIVNEQLITRADFQKALDQAAQPYYRSHTPLPDAKLFRQKTLDALINRMLVLQLAAQNHVTISDQELQAAMGRIAAQNHLTVAELKQHIAHDPSGMSVAAFEKQLREQLLLTKIEMQAAGKPTVTPADIEAVRAKVLANPATSAVHLEDLLIVTDESTTDQQKKAIQAEVAFATERLKQQPNLEAIAHHATTQGLDATVNDLGERSPADLPSIFLPAVSQAKPGQIVGPIQAPNGYHFLKIVSKQSSAPHLTDEQLKQLAYEQKMQEAVEKWVQSISLRL